ncbi:extracellular solute-binding protein [Paenibacillus methanolicus]|uniref:Putative aldouronate transport system substrate-binding protein n=1 Tax=Paenibacillus methanolicus TaxID=582686 RepID=A0A5S5CBH2_9BACL|nr:extracellular solute-binding protein [Paenibacillus methanolicus]TYP76725.1 putative aldouronate transport system substrate-binding protein [Paenibacillus methanolicus]
MKSNFVRVGIVTMLVGSLLAGCSTEKSTETATNSPKSSEAASANPDDKTPIKVTWFVADESYKKNWDPVNNALDKKITEDTGVSIEFTSGNNDKLSALIASGDIPDMITVDKTAPQRGVLENSGLVAPLDELIQQYDPSFNVPKSMQDWFRNPDGHFYGYANYFWAKENRKPGDTLYSNQGLFARKDIMDQLGIKPEDFSTKEGLVAALRKVKDSKTKYNGFDVAPAYFDSWVISSFFGSPREDEQGNLVDRERTPEALEAYRFLNRLYHEGLLPEDSQTLNTAQLTEKVNNGAVFALSKKTIKWDGLYAKDPNAIFVAVGPVIGDQGKQPIVDPVAASGWTLTMVSSKAKHQDRIVKFMNYLTDEEMNLNVTYGPKGITWDYDANGKVKLSDEFIKARDEDAAKAKLKYGNGTLNWLISYMPVQRTLPVTGTLETEGLKSNKHFGKYTYDMLAFENTAPLGGTEEAGISAKLEEVRAKTRAKMILAKSPEDLDKFYKEGIAQEEKLGYQKLYDYQNAKFQEAKKALGVQFVWPTNMKK